MFEKNLDKIFELIPGGIFGLLSVLFGLIGDVFSIMLYPGYNFTKNMASDLGVGPGGIIFNISLVLSGASAILFYLYFGRVLNGNNPNDDKLVNIAIFFAILSSFFMIMIGFFPASLENDTILVIHSLSALFSWLTGISYSIIFSYLILKNTRFSNYLAFISIAAALAFGSLLIAIAIPWAVIIVPSMEWIMIVVIIVYVMALASYTLHYKM
ncbi:MAG: DUF998 domain-containing protein [Candidatus Lokiarchaeota archaeon]|nr:DUF998 domain-containing protein [Candidatus Lokiarchaeota archaeon]